MDNGRGLIAASLLTLVGSGCGIEPHYLNETEPSGESREGQTNHAPEIEMIKSPRESYIAGEEIELEFRVSDDSDGVLLGEVKYDCPPPYGSSIITSNGRLNKFEFVIGEEENPYVREGDGRYSIKIYVYDCDYGSANGSQKAFTTFYFRVEGLKAIEMGEEDG